MSQSSVMRLAIGLAVVLVLILLGSRCVKSVPAGSVAVATFFGKVIEKGYPEGLHFPVNPFYKWTIYDARQKTHKETANVPSQDQLSTQVDVSVQYRIRIQDAPRILKNTGTMLQVIDVHLIPKLRSILREQGKRVAKAEDFFREETQTMLQDSLRDGMRQYLSDKGLEVSDVLIRDINLPPFIVKAIEKKKEREQEAEKQKAELVRYKTEMQQKVAKAEAEREAAAQEAERKRTLADAKAYEIEKINQALANSPGYIRLQALEALKEISKDPAAKIYFMNGDAPMPLPLMHLGDKE